MNPPNTVPFLSLRGVVKSFGPIQVLRGIDLDIQRGEFVCFLGPSGCGKTTLLRVIAGLDQQNAGTILIGGRDVSRLPSAERDYGIVFQSYALFPNLTVAQNVGYGLVNLRTPANVVAGRVADLLELVGLSDQSAKYPVQLSGGQQQRVALARAIATSPELLLLDEPLSALDAKVRVRLRDEIRQLQKRLGVTTIMVTHDQEEALSMADRIVVMNGGVAEQIGTPQDIYCRPATTFVADFVGHMTFLDAIVTDSRHVRVDCLDLQIAEDIRHAPGTPVRVGMRPEEVHTRLVTTTAPNSFEARIDELSFLGAFCRATLRPIGSPATCIAADLSPFAMRNPIIAPGAIVSVACPPAALHIFDGASR
jgi:iron(III) transport system ATP-binding protein